MRLINFLILVITFIFIQAYAGDKEIITNKDTFKEISGFYTPGSMLELYRNDVKLDSMKSSEQGEYIFSEIELMEGKNLFRITSDGRTIDTLIIVRDSTLPIISLLTDKQKLNKSFYVSDLIDVSFSVNEPVKDIFAQTPDNKFIKLKKIKDAYSLNWVIPYTLVYHKPYTLKIMVTDFADNWASNEEVGFQIIPKFYMITPTGNVSTDHRFIDIVGYADLSMKVYIDGELITQRDNGVFNQKVLLDKAKSLITVKVEAPGMDTITKVFKVAVYETFGDMSKVKDKAVQQSIETLASLKIISQEPIQKFRPDEAITKAELATWLIKAMGGKVPEVTASVAKDVPAEYWRAPYIKLAIEYGFFKLDGDGYFWPNEEVSEAEGKKIFDNFDIQTIKKKSSRLFNYKMFFFALLKWPLFLLESGVNAEESEVKKLDREEAAKKLSESKYVQERMKAFLDWSKGFSSEGVARRNAPEIKKIEIVPGQVFNDGSSLYTLEVQIFEPSGLNNIKGVLADLTDLGGMSEYTLVDNGKWGDKTPMDGTYTMQSFVKKTIIAGEKAININASNRTGWVAVSTTQLKVQVKE